jgi:hypothetical protein
MTAAGKRYLAWLASQPCASCAAHGVEIAHIRGCLSPKTGGVLPRRKGPAYYYAIPLCPDCHRHGEKSIHNVGEEHFFARVAYRDPHQLVASYLCRFFEGGR